VSQLGERSGARRLEGARILVGMKSLVILISGRGSNMEAIVRAAMAERWPVRLAGVVSNRPQAAGLAFARAQGLATAVVDHRDFGPSPEGRIRFDAALADAIDALSAASGGAPGSAPQPPDLVALAGFMRVLGPDFVQRYAERLLNIHPSLLPAFPGLHTHERALAAGCRFAGATVHLVTPELDHGPIAAQAVVPVQADDTPESLAARVLSREHMMYPRVLRWWIEDRLVLREGRFVQLDGEPMRF
jgi:phosphoribosylglycinamide formyltransferase 1